MKPLIKTVQSFPISIFIAGDYLTAVNICQEYCNQAGFCVTVDPTKYVYSNGLEEGVVVGLINYPRYPKFETELYDHALKLAERLRTELNQESFSIQTPKLTFWYSYRKQDANIA
jgi:hypothetical protein